MIASKILNGDDTIYDVYNEYNHKKVTDKKRGRYQFFKITDDNRKLMISRQSYSNLKENFLNHKWKHNVSLTLYHEPNPKKLEYSLVDNKP